jgi:hypothetical protein
MIIAADNYIEWVSSDSLPAGKFNDISHIAQDGRSIDELFDPRDKIAFDGGYKGVQKYIKKVRGSHCNIFNLVVILTKPYFLVQIPHITPQNGELTGKELDENKNFGKVRGRIERR